MRESTIRLAVLTVFAGILGALSSCASRYNQPPKTMMIEEAFFACSKCGSLDGGIFGKGPVMHLSSADAAHCVHTWRTVSKSEFEALATQRFGVDWSKEIPYWRETTTPR